MIKKFENFKNKSVAVFHGLGGRPANDRIELLKYIGYNIIYYPHINYEYEWNLDKCKSMFNDQLKNIKDIDLLIGISLGGYLAYLLASETGKDLVLINPSLDRQKSKLEIKEFGNSDSNLGNVDIFFGENDKLINMNDQIEYLDKNNIIYNRYIIRNMEHRVPIDKFREILEYSKLV